MKRHERKIRKMPKLPKLFSKRKDKTGGRERKLIFRIYSTYLVILVFMMIVAGVGLYSGSKSQKVVEDLYTNRLQSVSEMMQLAEHFEDLNGRVASALLLKGEAAKAQVPKIEELEDEVRQGIALLQEKWEVYGLSESDVGTFMTVWQNYEKDLGKIKDFINNNDESDSAGSGNSMTYAVSIYNQNLTPKIETSKEILKEAVDINTTLAQESFQASQENQKALFSVQIVLSVLAALISVIIGGAMARSILKPLIMVVEAAKEIAQGNLRQQVQVKNRDELGQLAAAFNQMAANIRELIEQIQASGKEVATSAHDLSLSTEQTKQSINQIANMIEEVASGAEVQVQSVEESKQAIDEMVDGIQKITDSVGVVSASSQSSAKEAELGNEAIQKAVQQMGAIKESTSATAEVVRDLAKRSANIGEIVKTITGITEQTNLLALNATIEAARAGEHGRGFAVVAEEVRKLAEQTGESARQIAQLIAEIQADTNRAVESMNKGTHEVDLGMEIIQEAGAAFQKILATVQQVASQSQEVSAVTVTLSANSEQVAAAVAEMARIAQDSSANTQGVAATTEEQLAYVEEISVAVNALNQMADKLQEAINRFKV